jgi:Ion channel
VDDVKRQHIYRYLLAGTLLLYLLIIVAPFRDVQTPVRVAVLGILLLLAVRTRRRGRHLFVPAAVLSVALVITTVVAVVVGSTTVLICVGQAATAVLVVASIFILGQTIIASGVVDGQAVGGVLCIYLLLGLLFSALHDFCAALIPHYLSGVGSQTTQSDTLYFSLITLTTVGFGDITPEADIARAIAATEALVGQLYLVSVVAAVVSRFRPQRLADAQPGLDAVDNGTDGNNRTEAGIGTDGANGTDAGIGTDSENGTDGENGADGAVRPR